MYFAITRTWIACSWAELTELVLVWVIALLVVVLVPEAGVLASVLCFVAPPHPAIRSATAAVTLRTAVRGPNVLRCI